MLKYLQLINPVLNAAASVIWMMNIYRGHNGVGPWVVLCLQLIATALTSYVAWRAWGR